MTARGQALIECVTSRIAEIVPKGLGRWDRAWELAAAPSDAFFDAVLAWEKGEDTPERRQPVTKAADEMVRAWRRAAEEWKAAGYQQVESSSVGAVRTPTARKKLSGKATTRRARSRDAEEAVDAGSPVPSGDDLG